MVVTMFMMIAAVLTARELLDMYFEERRGGDSEESDEANINEQSTHE